MPMLETNRLSVRYGTKTIVDSLSFSSRLCYSCNLFRTA